MHIYLDVFQEAVILSPIRSNLFTTVLYLVIGESIKTKWTINRPDIAPLTYPQYYPVPGSEIKSGPLN